MKYQGILITFLLFLAACAADASPQSVPEPKTLTIAGWYGYMPPALLEAFQAETGIAVEYVPYDTQEEALERLQQGAAYDLMVMGSHFIPRLVAEGIIAPLNYANIPNARNIGANFRDLSFDPGNRHSIIYQWGTTGLLIRTDLIDRPIMRWADLWDPALEGKILLWPIPRDMTNILLKSLGYSINTTNPAYLATALQRAPELARRADLAASGEDSAVPYLATGEYAVAQGWSYDALLAREQGVPITYIIPDEGTILWFDCLVVPAFSPHKALAERFIDFFLRPEMSALVTNELGVPTANDAAWPLIDPLLQSDEAIFPLPRVLQGAEVEAFLDPETQAYYDKIWQAFLRGQP